MISLVRPGRLADIAVAIFAIALAGFMLVRSFPESDELWRDLLHDRNSHYGFGLKLALHARDFDIVGFLVELEKPKVWPQLHGLVLAAVLLVAGIDHRLGIVPSLLGWALTVWFCWKIAVRSFNDSTLGTVAGMAAVAFVATSPAFALISTDVMLEGLGSGLSALCLWAFNAAQEEPDKAWRWRLLAAALTLLFFEKYNYWGFVVTSIAFTGLLIDARVRTSTWSAVRASLAHASKLLRSPLFLGGVAVLGAAAAIGMRGPTAFNIFSNRVSVYPPSNVVTIGYALLFGAGVQIWRAHRTAIARFIGLGGSVLLAWHVLPVAVSFLLPQRLASSIWFLGPSNNPARSGIDINGAYAVYTRAIVEGFFSIPAIGWACLALFATAAVFVKRTRPEARIVFVFAAVSAIALLVHPQHQQRFLSTSMFALFCGAGLGLAVVAQFISPRNSSTKLAIGGVAALAVLAVQFWLPYPATAYATAIRARSGPSNLDLVALYRPFVRPGEDLAIGGTFGDTALLYWPLFESCKCTFQIDRPWVGLNSSRAEVAASGKSWLETTTARQAVLIDMPGYRGTFLRYETIVGLVDAVSSQTRFQLVRVIESHDPPARILLLQRPRDANGTSSAVLPFSSQEQERDAAAID